MINLFNWVQRKFIRPKVYALSEMEVSPIKSLSTGADTIQVYLNDPTTPELMMESPFPHNTLLNIHALGEQGGGFPLGSIQQQAGACKHMVNEALTYMASKSPKPITKWAAVNSLSIMPRAGGKEINAFYDRNALKFFFFGTPAIGKIIYACNNRGVVTHELGHAFLDILRPEFWSSQSLEVWGLHEAFGDMTALLDLLQHDELIESAIKDTNGNLMSSNIISRLAAEMGMGLYKLTDGKDGELPNCLRDLTIKFLYVTPSQLPNVGPDNIIINEPHSFSRILSGAFYELVVQMAGTTPTLESVKNARDIAAHYLVNAVSAVPHTVRLFDAFCKQMLQIDEKEGGKYQEIMKQIFNQRNLLQQRVIMLESVDIQQVKTTIDGPYEVQKHGTTTMLRTLGTKKMKLSDKLGVVALDNNPLLDLEIEVPNESAYYFDHEDKLVDIISPSDTEITKEAYNCLFILNNRNLVGSHETALFEETYGKLVRKQMAGCCGRPNYCDPNAPEYRKPWKPANNSGCSACHHREDCKPQSCECAPPEPGPPPKLGCYTEVKSGIIRNYRTCQFTARKVC